MHESSIQACYFLESRARGWILKPFPEGRVELPGPLSGLSGVDNENRQHGLFKLLTLPLQVTASARRSNGCSN